MEKDYKITSEQVEVWTVGTLRNTASTWLAEILNGEYSAEEARDDCLSIVDEAQRKKERQ